MRRYPLNISLAQTGRVSSDDTIVIIPVHRVDSVNTYKWFKGVFLVTTWLWSLLLIAFIVWTHVSGLRACFQWRQQLWSYPLIMYAAWSHIDKLQPLHKVSETVNEASVTKWSFKKQVSEVSGASEHMWQATKWPVKNVVVCDQKRALNQSPFTLIDQNY